MNTNSHTVPRVAVIGCGHWGKNLVRNFAELGALAAVCDRRGVRAREFSEQHGVRAERAQAIMQDASIDAVAIATPADSHFAVAREALLAGKHVFVEKPLALEVAAASELQQLAGERQRVLMAGHLLQYHPAFLRLKALVAAGELGQLRHIYSHRLNPMDDRRSEGVLWDLACHDVSMILSLADSAPNRVSACGGPALHSRLADIAATQITFPAMTAHILVSWLHPGKEQRLVLVGDEGTVVFDDAQPWQRKLLMHRRPGCQGSPDAPEPEPVSVAPGEPLRHELEHFLDCVAGKASCRTDATEAIRVLEVLQAAEQDAGEHRDTRPEDGAPRMPEPPETTAQGLSQRSNGNGLNGGFVGLGARVTVGMSSQGEGPDKRAQTSTHK